MNRKRHNNLNNAIESEVNEEKFKKKKTNVFVSKTKDVNKRTIVEEDERHNLNANKSEANVKKAKKKKNKSIVNVNKRIIFEEDDPSEIPCKTPKDSNHTKDKPKQCLPEDEAAIKDEDIDNFCDEVDEEDNVQYENWVKSIEEMLKSNKKKPK